MKNDSLTFLIFSKDRPLQLHALLSSLAVNVDFCPQIMILFRASNSKFLCRYHEVFKDLESKIEVVAIHEDYAFRSHVINLIEMAKSEFISFLVDDIIFIRSFSIKPLFIWCKRGYIPSLRLGQSISYSYMTRSEEQRPKFKKLTNCLTWSWGDGEVDWCYPLSLDGNIFKRSEIVNLIKNVEFRSPNTLESALQIYNQTFRKRKGFCFKNPVLVNNPCNRVQIDYVGNRAGDLNIEDLARVWDSGMRIAFESFKGMTANSVHVELDLTFTPREGEVISGGPPKVSVVMPSYNVELYIGHAIESILQQTFKNYELIVIDDGSTDGTAEIVRSFNDSRICYFRNEINMGISYTRNKGIELSRGEYIAWLDADDIALPRRLELQVAFLDQHSNFGLCCANAQTIDCKGNLCSDPWWKDEGLPLEWELMWGNPIAQSSVTIRRSLLNDATNRYRKEKAVSEDYDLWTRLFGQARMIRLPEVLIHYRNLEGSAYHSKEQYALNESVESNRNLFKKIIGDIPLWQSELTAFVFSNKYQRNKHIEYITVHKYYIRAAKVLSEQLAIPAHQKRAINSDISHRLTIYFLWSTESVPKAVDLLGLLLLDTRRTWLYIMSVFKNASMERFPKTYTRLKLVYCIIFKRG